MNSNHSEPRKSASPGKESPRQKRIYMRQGILESKKDFAERFFKAMLEAGIIPSRGKPDCAE